MRSEKENRLGEERLNNQGCLMKIIEYNNVEDIVVEFQDEYKAKLHTKYGNFKRGIAKNPYYKSVYNIAMIGIKYPTSINGNNTKEYCAWTNIIKRCHDKKFKQAHPTYKDVTCCSDWLCYENFCDWLYKQENFDKWLNGDRWEVDKDILYKKNIVYSPDTCCLVPHNVNSLFVKSNKLRGDLPIGVIRQSGKFAAYCKNYLIDKRYHKFLGIHETIEEAFNAYKQYKENLIKQVAEIEYKIGNITEKCYQAMLNYAVEIDD